MRDHEDFREYLEKAEHRRSQRIANMLEQRDKMKLEQEKLDQKHKEARRREMAKASGPGGVSSGIPRDEAGRSLDGSGDAAERDGDVEMGEQDELGIPLATGTVVGGLKRGAADLGGDAHGQREDGAEHVAVRPRLEGGKREAEGGQEHGSAGRRQRLEHVGVAKWQEQEARDEILDHEVKQPQQDIHNINGDTTYDVCELFSPPRVCPVATEMGLRGGYSLDLTWQDEITGHSWDMMDVKNQNRLWNLLKRRRPRLLIASPPCTTFSALQNLRRTPMPDAQRRHGEILLGVAVQACRHQHRAGQFFLMEHPLTARSWRDTCVQDLLKLDGVYTIDLDQCEYGLRSRDERGVAPAMKPTRLITNMPHARVTLSKRCSKMHRHVQLMNNRARSAQQYTLELCRAMVQALQIELTHNVELYDVGEETHWEDNLHEDQDEKYNGHWDENSGRPLDPIKVRRGREKELQKIAGAPSGYIGRRRTKGTFFF